jgi:hypothetical protein
MYRDNAVLAYLALHLPNLQHETPLQPKIYGSQCERGCFTASPSIKLDLLQATMPVLIGWVIISFACLYQFHLSALVIQPGRRLPMPFVGATSPAEPLLTTKENRSTTAEITALPSTEIEILSTGFSASNVTVYTSATLPSTRSSVRKLYTATTRKYVISPRTTRFRRPIELPGENRITLRKKDGTTSRITLPTALPVFTGPASEVKTVFYPSPAVSQRSSQFYGNDTDERAAFSASHLPGPYDVVQTVSAVLTAAGSFKTRSLWFCDCPCG